MHLCNAGVIAPLLVFHLFNNCKLNLVCSFSFFSLQEILEVVISSSFLSTGLVVDLIRSGSLPAGADASAAFDQSISFSQALRSACPSYFMDDLCMSYVVVWSQRQNFVLDFFQYKSASILPFRPQLCLFGRNTEGLGGHFS